ncbi:MAG TPA: hypothetical protein DCX27_21890 [Balneola sp.]|nr:hypothetical protein [Balneola sp.]|tara:strand:+ start:416 stop:802 length:387 start_codon:yes stop_codon:yes gene_type:complete
MKITEKLLKQVVTESLKRTLLKEFYSEKDFDPKQSRNRNWDGKVSWNQGFIEEIIPGKFIMHTVGGKRVPKLDADGNPIPKTKTLRDIRTGKVQSIVPGYGTVIGIAKIIDDSTGEEVEVEIAELTKV